MKFNLIEGAYADLDSIHDEFCEDYLWSTELTNVEIRKKYGLTVKEFNEFAETVKKEFGISCRPRKDSGRYYYKRPFSWFIQKKIDGVLVYFGSVPTEEIAKQVVELCIACNWDLNTCFEFVHNWRYYVEV